MTDNPQEKGVRIPLSFDDALKGLLAVDAKKLPPSAQPGAKKKPARAAKKGAKGKKRG